MDQRYADVVQVRVPADGVAAGTYTWAVGIVDTTRENAIGINLALRADQLTDGGWAKLTTLTVR